MGGGSRVSATTVMRSVRRAGESIARAEREAARALFSDGVAPEADTEAAHVLVEADGTYVTVRGGGPKAEVKAMVAYAGKEATEGGVFCQALLSHRRHEFVSHFPSSDDRCATASVTAK